VYGFEFTVTGENNSISAYPLFGKHVGASGISAFPQNRRAGISVNGCGVGAAAAWTPPRWFD
jgi:hypothetical protein